MRLDKTNHKSTPGRVRGVLLLAASGILVKAAGLLFKIPMNYAIGDAGMGYYNAAYSLYTLFYTAATAGLPVALSVMIATLRAEGNFLGERQTVRRATWLSALIGVAGSLSLILGAKPLSELIRSPGSTHAVRAIGGALFFICLSSTERGAFQGAGSMTPTALSQLAEAFGKLVCGLFGAAYALGRGYSTPVTAAFAAGGVTIGSFFSTAILFIIGWRQKRRDGGKTACGGEGVRLSETLAGFRKIALPVTLSSFVMGLSSMADTGLIQRVLRENGMDAVEAAARFGNYTSLAVPMMNLPVSFVYPVAYALVPMTAAALAEGGVEEAKRGISDALRWAALVGVLCAVGLAALSRPILSLLFRESSAAAAAPLLTLLSPSSFLLCVAAVTNAALQGAGGQREAVVSMTASALVKWLFAAILLRKCGMAGAPLSTLLGYLTLTTFNLAFLRRKVGSVLPLGEMTLDTFAGGISGMAAKCVYGSLSARLSQNLAAVLAGICLAAFYISLLFVFRATTTEKMTRIARRFGIVKRKEHKNDRRRSEKEADVGENPRYERSRGAGANPAFRGGLPVGSGAGSSLHPQRVYRRNL